LVERAVVQARLEEVRARMARAAGRAGRDSGSIRLVAVSKTFGAETVRLAASFGQIDFGENKVQEAIQKMPPLGDLRLTWHLVGHLQTNKVRKAAAHFDVVHSIDSAELVGKLDRAALDEGRRLSFLAQVDLAGEVGKHGAREAALPSIFEAAAACRAIQASGLMLLPPAAENPEDARPWFRELRAVRDRLTARGVDPSMLRELSMGMSHDFEIAIEEGATLIRVGTAIFGSR
jgi:pyridoxal phosphate enzyme (YggS family)